MRGNDHNLVAIAEAIKRARRPASAGRDQRVNKAASCSWAKIAGMYRHFFQDIVGSESSPVSDLEPFAIGINDFSNDHR